MRTAATGTAFGVPGLRDLIHSCYHWYKAFAEGQQDVENASMVEMVMRELTGAARSL